MNIRIEKEITLEFVRTVIHKSKTVYYGAQTPWWTLSETDLYKQKSGLPCDPRRGVLFQTDKPLEFLASAEKNPNHYGQYGLRTFLLAYHGCVVVKDGPDAGQPTCLDTWEKYDQLITSTITIEGKNKNE